MNPAQLAPYAPIAKGALLGGGLLAVLHLARGAPPLDDEDRRRLALTVVGVPVFCVLLVAACRNYRWPLCAELVPSDLF